MLFFINLILAVLAFLAVRYMSADIGADKPVSVILGILAAICVFLADPATHLV